MPIFPFIIHIVSELLVKNRQIFLHLYKIILGSWTNKHKSESTGFMAGGIASVWTENPFRHNFEF